MLPPKVWSLCYVINVLLYVNYSGKHYHYQGIGKKGTLMHIGVCTIQLYIHSSRSLKDKRQILRSITDRLRQKFNVSVAACSNCRHIHAFSLTLSSLSSQLATCILYWGHKTSGCLSLPWRVLREWSLTKIHGSCAALSWYMSEDMTMSIFVG